MTAQPIETDTLIDIAAMVGEMEAPPCEHSTHQSDKSIHDDGPAVCYVLAGCPTCRDPKNVYAACQRFIGAILGLPEFYCPRCFTTAPPSEFITILGPVNL
jgi:hypothetical protein